MPKARCLAQLLGPTSRFRIPTVCESSDDSLYTPSPEGVIDAALVDHLPQGKVAAQCLHGNFGKEDMLKRPQRWGEHDRFGHEAQSLADAASALEQEMSETWGDYNVWRLKHGKRGGDYGEWHLKPLNCNGHSLSHARAEVARAPRHASLPLRAGKHATPSLGLLTQVPRSLSQSRKGWEKRERNA